MDCLVVSVINLSPSHTSKPAHSVLTTRVIYIKVISTKINGLLNAYNSKLILKKQVIKIFYFLHFARNVYHNFFLPDKLIYLLKWSSQE